MPEPAAGISHQGGGGTFLLEPNTGGTIDITAHIEQVVRSIMQPASGSVTKKFFMDQDDDAHWYLVDNAVRDAWFAWLKIPSDDERAWTPPEGAERLHGPPSMILFTLADDEN